jgi:FMN-dependent NADH-azoreductase
MNILHIDSSVLGSASLTRELSAAVVAEIRNRHPAATVIRRDVAADEIRHLNGAIAAGFRPTVVAEVDDATRAEHGVSEALVTEFLASDVLVIGAPMYNFSIPSQLKSWMDRIAQAGRTFQYTATGPVGLAGGKRVIVVSARGGFYADGPLSGMDFQESYLRAYFGFLGITDVQIIRAEGASKGEAARAEGRDRAKAAIPDTVAELRLTAA